MTAINSYGNSADDAKVGGCGRRPVRAAPLAAAKQRPRGGPPPSAPPPPPRSDGGDRVSDDYEHELARLRAENARLRYDCVLDETAHQKRLLAQKN